MADRSLKPRKPDPPMTYTTAEAVATLATDPPMTLEEVFYGTASALTTYLDEQEHLAASLEVVEAMRHYATGEQPLAWHLLLTTLGRTAGLRVEVHR